MQVTPMNYFERSLQLISEINETLKAIKKDLNSEDKTNEKAVEIFHRLSDLFSGRLEKELNDFTWTIGNLDSETDRIVLESAFKVLSDLQTQIHIASYSLISNSLISERDETEAKVQRVYQALEKAIIGTHEKTSKLYHENRLPYESEVGDWEMVEPGATDLTLYTRAEKISASSTWGARIWGVVYYPFQSNSDSFVFNRGGLIPCRVSSYIHRCDVNAGDDVAEIISMIKGERMKADLTPFMKSDGSICDKYGEFVKAPEVFVLDLNRMNEFHINDRCFFDHTNRKEGNLNETGRELYRQFGKIGGERIMQICHQGILAHSLGTKVLPLCLDGGAWKMQLPGKMILPSDDCGLVFKVEKVGADVHIRMKILMKLHTTQEETFTAHFVMASHIIIPEAELTKEGKVDDQKLASCITVKDFLSTLVVDNPLEAKELFQKFPY